MSVAPERRAWASRLSVAPERRAWASRLWVGGRKEPILGYVPKNDEKKNSVLKGLTLCHGTHFVIVLLKENTYYLLLVLFE